MHPSAWKDNSAKFAFCYNMLLKLLNKVGFPWGYPRVRDERNSDEHERDQDSGQERRAAAASGDRLRPGPRARGGQDGPQQGRPRCRAGGGRRRLGSLPPRPGLPSPGERVGGGRAHGDQGGRRPTPRLRGVLLHLAGREAAGGLAYSPKGVEGKFCELRLYEVLGSQPTPTLGPSTPPARSG